MSNELSLKRRSLLQAASAVAGSTLVFSGHTLAGESGSGSGAEQWPTACSDCFPVTAVKVCGGYIFPEGPTADANGNLYFVDAKDAKIYRVDTDRPGECPTLVRGNTLSINGMAFDEKNNRLIGAQLKGNNIVAVNLGTAQKDIEVLAYGDAAQSVAGARAGNPPFRIPHKVALDDTGGIYFSCTSDMDWTGDLSMYGVFYLYPDGRVVKLLDEDRGFLPRPNGLAISIDQRTLYVNPAAKGQVKGEAGVLYAYPIVSPGHLAGDPKQIPLPGRTDGIASDWAGNLYVTLPVLYKILVISPSGQWLSSISIPEGESPTTNCAFAGKDRNTLFVTSSNSLFKIVPMGRKRL